MEEYREEALLDDGTAVTVRSTSRDDLDKVIVFFEALPDEDKQCVKVELCSREDFERRYDRVEKGLVTRLVIEKEGRIVGEASLETMRYGWLRKSGEVRMIVLPEYRGLGASKILAREIFLLAARRGLENLLARVVDCRKEAVQIFESLHFRHEASQKCHAVDMEGKPHDVHLLTFSLRKMWRDMEEAIVESIASPLD